MRSVDEDGLKKIFYPIIYSISQNYPACTCNSLHLLRRPGLWVPFGR